MQRMVLIFCLFFATSLATFARVPNVQNAGLAVRQAQTDLSGQIADIIASGGGTYWIAYSVPAIDNLYMSCAYEDSCLCPLEGEKGWYSRGHEDDPRVAKQSPSWLDVFIKVKGSGVDKIQMYSTSCGVDAGGAEVLVLENANPRSSADLLAGLVVENKKNRVRQGAIAALASHRHQRADEQLEHIAGSDFPRKQRKDAIFWIGNSRGDRGYFFLRDLYANEADSDVRQHMTFAFSMAKNPEATEFLKQIVVEDEEKKVRGQALFWLGNKGGPEAIAFLLDIAWNERDDHLIEQSIFGLSQADAMAELIQIAREHEATTARSKALFWLGQKSGEKATETLTDAVENDPEIEVKQQAVFALSQLPDQEGVPKLIEIAKTHKNPKVREKALFWLGQSGSDEALKLFEEILLEQ